MESVLLKLRQASQPIRVGSFYSLFLSIVIVFVTIFYILMMSQLTHPVEMPFDKREDIEKIENELGLPYRTIGIFSNTSHSVVTNAKLSRNITSEVRKKRTGDFHYRNLSSQYVQGILRSLTYNKTLTNITLNMLRLNVSKEITNIDRYFHVQLHVNESRSKGNFSNGTGNGNFPDGTGSGNFSDRTGNATAVKLSFKITADVPLNSSKVISVENNELKTIKIDNPPLVRNISGLYKKNLTNYLNIIQRYRNITRVRNSNLRNRDSRRPNYCPLWPDELVGPMQVDQFMNRTEIPIANKRWIKEGGRFKPPDCDPRERTAIIIPYRDREKNLMVLLRHLHTVLQRQKIEYGIYVIEIAYPTQFNRGLLANVGFLTASSVAPYTCYIIHDVDLLVQDDRNMYRCGRVPRHLTATNSKFNNKLPYAHYFGGVEAFTPDQYWEVNGFSNLYFGWGGEDDDMLYRIFHTKKHFSRPNRQIGGYVAIEHEKDSTNPKNPNRKALVKSAARRMEVDGLRSVSYNRLALEFKPFYTWVYIAAKEAKIMEKYQEYLEDN